MHNTKLEKDIQMLLTSHDKLIEAIKMTNLAIAEMNNVQSHLIHIVEEKINNQIVFDVKLVQQNDKNVIKITATKNHKYASIYFNPPSSAAELTIDLTATLNSLMSELGK